MLSDYLRHLNELVVEVAVLLAAEVAAVVAVAAALRVESWGVP